MKPLTYIEEPEEPTELHKVLLDAISTAEAAIENWRTMSFENTTLANALEHGNNLFQVAADVEVFSEAVIYVKRQRIRQLKVKVEHHLRLGMHIDAELSACAELMRKARLYSWYCLSLWLDQHA